MFSGRIDRTGLILGIGYLLVPIVEAIVAYFFLSLIIGQTPSGQQALDVITLTVGCPYVVLWAVLFASTTISLFVRRWHDLELSGWLSLLFLLPLVGIMAGIMLMVTEGSAKANKYGRPNSPRRLFAVLFGE